MRQRDPRTLRSLISIYCSRNQAGASCAESVFADFTFVTACASEIDECSDRCENKLTIANESSGCCAFSYLYAVVLSFCSNISHTLCIGGVSGGPLSFVADAGDERDSACDELLNTLPNGCETYLLTLNSTLRSDPESIIVYCRSNCAEPVYEYIAECRDSEFSIYVDLACSKNSEGSECVSVFGDDNVITAIEVTCSDASDKQCSSDCSDTLRDINDEWGYWAYSYIAILTNATYTTDLWLECEVDVPGFCLGELSSDEGHEGDPADDGDTDDGDGGDTDYTTVPSY